jgi:hypothetical protein
VLRDLAAIAAVSAPSVPSLLRRRPGYFAGAYQFWGWSLHTVWLLTPGTPAAKWICLIGLLIRLLPGRATSVRLVITY